MARLVKTVSKAEKRSQLEVLEDLDTLAVGDVVRIRSSDSLHPTSSTIPMDDGFSLFEQAKDLMGHGNIARSAKAIYVELCCRYAGKSQRAIAKVLGYNSETSITKQRKRLKEKLKSDKKLMKRLKMLGDRVVLSIVKV